MEVQPAPENYCCINYINFDIFDDEKGPQS
jgi:hypothetical protein